ncbi:uncharacterized protein LOC131688011 [Topomyia yanbarensis]|uniref:uncharacterized protein LOC131688011 n=1 Tax=Topomyia yanbarensis TaxID=2498891 RepID=UPI00273BE393|nr:uncharacterized protein LOC131688011 [Topomyia yanbarensis]
MSDQELDYTTTPCGKCGLAPKELGGMVACDHCNNWYDYACAGVTDTVKRKKKWFCDNAVCVAAAKKRTKKDANPQSTADESDAGSVKSSTVPSADEQIKAMEEEQRRLEADWDKQMLVKEKQLEFQMQLEEEWRCFELAELERENQLQLQVKHEHLKRVQKLEKDFREQMSTVDNQLDTMKMERQQKHSRPITVKNQSTPLLAPAGKTGICVESEMDDTEESSSSEEETDNEPDEKVKQGSRPTKGQLAARHGIGKHLPLFSGKSDDWPLFYAAYNSSTKACGFSDIDNLARLQQCLRGDALELVRGQLLLPKSVPRVIEKLRQHFGRPEQLLDRLLERVKELPAPKNLKGFIPFANVVEQLCDHVEAADLKEHLKNPLLIQGLIKKLPDAEKRQWADIKRAREGRKISLRTVTDFLLRISDDAREAEVDIERTTETRFSGEHSGRKRKEKEAVFSHAEEGNSNTVVSHRLGLKPCKVCQRTDHRLRFCQDFKNWSHAERVAMVTRDKLCKLCLGEHGGQCRFKFRCNVGSCKEAHNPLIHPVSTVGISAHIHSCNPLLFRIIPIQLHGRDRTLTVLAFLDEGASVTLIEGKLADRLGIVGAEEKLTIKWTADYSRTEMNSRKMNVWASAVGVGEKMLLRTVRTVGKLMLPHQKLDAAVLSARYQYMSDLPIASYEGQPELLIGLNNVHAFAPMEVKIGTVADPIAVRCKLGWTVYGPNQASHTTERGYVCLHHDVTNEDIHGLLKSHYALEESVEATAQESAEDKRAMEIMERTTKRIGERFQTGLLWKENKPQFPESIQMALRRNLQLERKLMKNPELYTKVRMQIEEYVEKGYAHLATKEELENTEAGKAWYLPINVVLEPKKPGKVRIVWDAAATVQGVSLNSKLLKGPDLLVPLVAVIIGFRERRIAFGGDLKEMFHQLKIIKEDRQAQRFLFRSNPEEDPKVYVMDVATFGSTCSPSSAQFVKNRNAVEHASQYPEAADAIINRHYVDDYFDSVDTIQEAVQRAKQVKLVHKNGGFEIRNWVSNSPEVLRSLGEDKPVVAVYFNQDKETLRERVLGLVWNPILDEFSFSTRQREEVDQYLHGGKRPTKRIAMSCVMGFFDPLGLLSLFTIHGKIVLQHLWRKGCDWDAVMDDESWKLWKRWVDLLPEVEAIRIPRCYIGNAVSTEIESLELHIFTDASEHAYGCVAYLRVLIKGRIQCSLVMSRAKVAPLKRQSIPRLELMAAVLGARMYRTIERMLTLHISRCVLWTDSRTVCSWLQSDQYKYKQFVAFRVGEILDLTQVVDWRWIPTKLNIADVLTKWGRGPPLQSDGEWFLGPSSLLLPECQWPSSQFPSGETDEDARRVVLFHEVIKIEAISRWNRLLRVTATVLRFIGNCKRKQKGLPILTAKATTNQQLMLKTAHPAVQTPLQKNELLEAEKVLWKQAQWNSFPDEMSVLTSNLQLAPGQKAERIPKRSALYKYSPTLDEDGVLRVDGRLVNAEAMSFNQRYPVILSRFHTVTKKIIQYYHEQFGHTNRDTVFNEIRKKFEIPNLRAAVSRVAGECVWCKVHRCVPHTPRMAPLPVQRVTPGKRPFNSVGVDYLGPVEVTVGRRKEKRWVAVFTCLAVRAPRSGAFTFNAVVSHGTKQICQ